MDWRGRNENLTTYSLVRVGVGVVLLSVFVVCTLASSDSMSVDSGLRLGLVVRVVMGGAGEDWAAERKKACRIGVLGVLPPRGRLVS